MSERIYMDNSATSFPKPPAVTEAMVKFARDCGASAGRGAYAEARQCEALLADCREQVARLINAESPSRVVFAMNCSEALMVAIRGLLNTAGPASHAIATAMEHNSVLRPLNALKQQTGLEVDFAPCAPRTGLVRPEDIRRAIRPQTRLIACVHVSNVTGTLQPVADVVEVGREAGVPVLIDAAQSVGHVPIDVQALGADFVAFPGHNGLLGPLGTGAIYIRPGMEERLATMKEGGTGTVSERPYQPETMPDKYEIGSHNAIGLAGLAQGVRWVLARGVETLRLHDEFLCKLFLEQTAGVDGLTVYGPRDIDHRAGVFSVNVQGLSPIELADAMEADFGVLTRPGLHCAPLAHQTIGTYPTGTCRFSFGPYTTQQDVQHATQALRQIAARTAAVR